MRVSLLVPLVLFGERTLEVAADALRWHDRRKQQHCSYTMESVESLRSLTILAGFQHLL